MGYETGKEPESPRTDDLGFGGVVVQRSRSRFMQRDGTPGVRKYGLGKQFWFRFYLKALAAQWLPFLVWSVGILLLANGVFAMGYLALGPAALGGGELLQLGDPFVRALYYSAGVFTSVGTGPMYPVGATAAWLTTFESLFGVLAVIGMLGIMLSKMLRPRARIRYTQSAIVAPYEGGRGLMFRMVNLSPAELFEMTVQITVSLFETVDGKTVREFHDLELERSSVEFFPLHWTVVHPIDAKSPIANFSPDQLREAKAEFMVMVTGWEDTFSTRVTSRTSYQWDEVRWDVKFADIFVDSPDGVMTIDVERLDRLDRLEEGATRTPAAREQHTA